MKRPAAKLYGRPMQQQAAEMYGGPMQQQAAKMYGGPMQQQAETMYGAPMQQQAETMYGRPMQQQAVKNDPELLWRNQQTRELISTRKTQKQQQRPESPTVTLTWHAS